MVPPIVAFLWTCTEGDLRAAYRHGPQVDLVRRRAALGDLRRELHLDLIGSTQGSREDPAHVRDLALAGKLRPVLARSCPLEDIARDQADFVAKDFIGKLVITTEKVQ